MGPRAAGCRVASVGGLAGIACDVSIYA
jgi:hypothetical protein